MKIVLTGYDDMGSITEVREFSAPVSEETLAEHTGMMLYTDDGRVDGDTRVCVEVHSHEVPD